MIRVILLVIAIVLGGTASAADKPIAEIRYEANKVTHLYQLNEGSNLIDHMLLTFRATGKPVQKKKLSRQQGLLIQNEITRLIWKNEFRKPASLKKCTPYASFSAFPDKTQICIENKAVTGQAIGLLTNLNGMFQ